MALARAAPETSSALLLCQDIAGRPATPSATTALGGTAPPSHLAQGRGGTWRQNLPDHHSGKGWGLDHLWRWEQAGVTAGICLLCPGEGTAVRARAWGFAPSAEGDRVCLYRSCSQLIHVRYRHSSTHHTQTSSDLLPPQCPRQVHKAESSVVSAQHIPVPLLSRAAAGPRVRSWLQHRPR